MAGLNERTVTVTGAAGGIGYAIAKAFVDKGDFVAVADLNEEATKEVANRLGSKAKGYSLDVTREESVMAFLQTLHAERGARYGLASLCIGGGQGVAMIIERA